MKPVGNKFDGTCFPKDINALIHTRMKYGINPLRFIAAWEQNKKYRLDWANFESAVPNESEKD